MGSASPLVLACFLLLVAFVQAQNTIYSSASSNYTLAICGVECGATESCACGTIEDALLLVPENTTDPYMISVLPGEYYGFGNVNISMDGRPISLLSASGSISTVIRCEPGESSFQFHNEEGTNFINHVQGFTLDGCLMSISNASTPTLRDIVVTSTNSTTFETYVITVSSGSFPQFESCSFHNISTKRESIIYISNSNTTIKESKFEYNGWESAAACIEISNSLLNQGILLISNSTFNYNIGILDTVFSNKANLMVFNSTFVGNNAARIVAGADSNISISGSDWYQNIGTSINTAGTDNVSCSLLLMNSTLQQNTAIIGSGGGIASDRCFLEIKDTTFDSNAAPFGGAASIKSPLASATQITSAIRDCLFVNNTAYNNFIINDESSLVSSNGGALFIGGSHNFFLVIENNHFIDNGAAKGTGGAIHTKNITGSDQNSLQLTNNTFENNYAVSGGAIFSSFRVSITSTIFLSNFADQHGGSLTINKGSILVEDCWFGHSMANQYGGAIYTTSDASGQIINSEFKNNTGLNGGGAFIQEDSAIDVLNSTFIDNFAVVMGGGISVQDFSSRRASSSSSSPFFAPMSSTPFLLVDITPTISSCIFRGNHAIKGGGLAISTEATPIISSCLFHGNNATLGGGVYFDDESGISLHDSTFIGNSGLYGGGIVMFGFSTGILTNLTLTNNTAQFDGGASSIGGSSSAFFIDSTFTGNSAGNQAGALDISGSSSPSFQNCSFVSNSAQRGGAFYTGQSGSPVFQSCQLTNNTASNFGGAGMISDGSSPHLLECNFEYNESNGEGGAVLVVGSPEPSFISCNFNYNHGYHGGALDINTNTVFTISKCRFQGNIAKTRGGGMRVSGSSQPQVGESLFIENYAVNGAGMAIYDDSEPFIRDTVFQENVALVQGGGVLSGDWSHPIFFRCVFLRNEVHTGTGGGIAISDFSKPVFNNSDIVSNVAPRGGGIYTISGGRNTVIYNCTFYRNHATSSGGGLSVHGLSHLTVSGCLFENNIAHGFGGAIDTQDNSFPVIEECILRSNFALRSGGGLSIQGRSYPQLYRCLLEYNFGIRGGGMFVAPRARGFMNSTTVANSFGFLGGGLYVGGFADFSVQRMIVNNNMALYNGGGMALESTATASFNQSLIRGNFALTGGGIYAFPVLHSNSQVTSSWWENPERVSGMEVWQSFQEEIAPGTDSAYLFADRSEFLDYIATTIEPYLMLEEEGNGGEGGREEEEFIPIPTFPNGPGLQFLRTFQDTDVIENSAVLGGGIAIFNAGAHAVSFDQNCTISDNFALEYGGGIYFTQFQSNQTFFFGTLIATNSARYGGGSVAWDSLEDGTLVDDIMPFCSKCRFDNNTAGYQTPNGFATPPANTTFVELVATEQTCPISLTLDTPLFDVCVSLNDHFGTMVQGKVLEDSAYNVTVACPESSCFLDASIYTLRVPPSGELMFNDLELSGKNNQSCTLVFSTEEYFQLYSAIGIPSFPAISCNITLVGCPSDEIVSSGVEYDTCADPNFLRANRLYVLFFVITTLLMSLILIMALQITLWYRKKRRVSWGKDLHVADFGKGKDSIKLEDILNDPNIPTIKWSDIEMGKKLGIGAAAIVRQGLWITQGKGTAIACKQLLLPTQQITAGLLRDFLVEIKLTSALYHDHVVRLIGVSCSPELDLYLITELMERGSIRDVLDAKGKNLHWDVRLKLLLDAAKGMEYLHSRKVIHRDLKPRNLLVNRNWMCKVADFGASTIQVKAAQTMTVIGTPSYMAPEVLAHTRYSEKADVYSFGIIIVEVATGEQPYSGPEYEDIRNQVQLIARIINDNLHPDTSALPPALSHLVYDCWNSDPDLRPSFAEIIMRLRRLGNIGNLMDVLPEEVLEMEKLSESEIEIEVEQPQSIPPSPLSSNLTERTPLLHTNASSIN